MATMHIGNNFASPHDFQDGRPDRQSRKFCIAHQQCNVSLGSANSKIGDQRAGSFALATGQYIDSHFAPLPRWRTSLTEQEVLHWPPGSATSKMADQIDRVGSSALATRKCIESHRTSGGDRERQPPINRGGGWDVSLVGLRIRETHHRVGLCLMETAASQLGLETAISQGLRTPTPFCRPAAYQPVSACQGNLCTGMTEQEILVGVVAPENYQPSVLNMAAVFGQTTRLPLKRTGLDSRRGRSRTLARVCESCRTMPLIGRSSRASPASPDHPLRRRPSILASPHTHRLSKATQRTPAGIDKSLGEMGAAKGLRATPLPPLHARQTLALSAHPQGREARGTCYGLRPPVRWQHWCPFARVGNGFAAGTRARTGFYCIVAV
ncbi:hypothetical protein PR048_015883 [Dryococelus australis]|uniref:Uncharacterized protein n=1 Tax=Dryococelus australis TaxID=614101 RepID=A0ABQ9HI62_9NEOP|nr:hypothetical protein PR048_015883 [Dryococelus australis]